MEKILVSSGCCGGLGVIKYQSCLLSKSRKKILSELLKSPHVLLTQKKKNTKKCKGERSKFGGVSG